MKRSQRGAVRVSIVWLVSVLVLFFVALFLAYSAYDAAAKKELEAQEALAKFSEGEKRWQAETKGITDISQVVGWYDQQAPTPRTNLEALNTEFKELKEALGAGPDVRDLRSLAAFAKTEYQNRGRTISSKDEEIDQNKVKANQAEQALRDSIKEKDTQLEQLRRELSDQTEAASSKQSDYEKRITELRDQVSQLDADLRESKAVTESADRKHADEVAAWETRAKVQGSKLAFLDEPEARDAKVIAVSKDLDLGWIDIGANNRLARGTRFRVVSGRPGATGVKAWAEVVGVEPQRAEVRFLEIADALDPVVAGDQLYNPLYDPKGQRYALLVGRFSGRYNEKELKELLGQMGIQVQDKLDVNTDYLVVGGEMYTDSDGNPVETPIQPSDLPEYKDAEGQGVQIVPLKDLRGYFAF